MFGRAGHEPSLLGLSLATADSGTAWIDHAGHLHLRVDEVRLDLEVGLPGSLLLERQVEAADPAAERPSHLLGGHDEADRVDRRDLGDGHAEQLAGLLVDDRAAAVARLERPVHLQDQQLAGLVPP